MSAEPGGAVVVAEAAASVNAVVAEVASVVVAAVTCVVAVEVRVVAVVTAVVVAVAAAVYRLFAVVVAVPLSQNMQFLGALRRIAVQPAVDNTTIAPSSYQ